MKNGLKSALCLAALAPFLFLFACPPPAGELPPGGDQIDYDKRPATKAEQEAILQNLGLSISTDAPKDAAGNPMKAGANPMGRKFTTLNPLCEIAVADFSYNGGKSFILDDGLAAYSTAFSLTGDDSWTESQYKGSSAADVDGDGFQEAVFVYCVAATSEAYVVVYDRNNGVYGGTLPRKLAGVSFTPPAESEYQNILPDMSACDLDADGRDEILLGLNNFYILDDQNAGFGVLGSITYNATTVVAVTAGNYDADPEPEFAVTHTDTAIALELSRLTIFNGSLDSPFSGFENQTMTPVVTDGGLSISIPYGNVCMQSGDIDGDGLEEIVVVGSPNDDPDYERRIVTVMDDAVHSFSWHDFYQIANGGPRLNKGFICLLDYNGDRKKEICTIQKIVEFPSGTVLETTSYPESSIPGNIITCAGGDVDGDHKEDLICMVDGSNSYISIDGLDASNAFVRKTTFTNGGNRTKACLLALNMDADSPVLEFKKRELIYSDLEVLAVLCSPPFHAGVEQAGGETSVGFSSSGGSSDSFIGGISNKTSIGGKFGPDKANISIVGSLELAFEYTHTTAHEVTQTFTFGCASGEDKVVFTATPMDVYFYTVTCSPDPSDVGDLVTINVPRESQFKSLTVETFNLANGGLPDIGQSVLNHSIGNVASYPTLFVRNSLIGTGAYYSDHTQPVGEGSSANGIDIEVTDSNEDVFGASVSVGLSVSFEGGSDTAKLLIGNETTVTFGYEHAICTASGTTVSGSVGNISSAALGANPDLDYQWGLFFYPATLSNGAGTMSFLTVNYWIE